MIAHPERRKGAWGTPLAIFVMTVVFGIIGWGCIQILTDVKDSIVDVKSTVIINRNDANTSSQKLWSAFTEFRNCENQSMVNCCKNTTIC